MDPIGAAQALSILEDHTTVPRDERSRNEVFAAFAVLRLVALGDSLEGSAYVETD